MRSKHLYRVLGAGALVILAGGIAYDLVRGSQEDPPSAVVPVREAQIQEAETGEYQVDASDHVSPHPAVSELPKESVSSQEEEALRYMREEEKLARDVYLTLYDKWGQNIFRTIAGSEQAHTDSIRYLLERYEIEDPVSDETVGVFTNFELQEPYTQ